MTDRKLPISRLIAYAVIVAITVLLALNFYPRDLKQVVGLKGITPDDITQIQLSMAVYEEPASPGMEPRAELIANGEVITDRAFFKDLLDLLENHTVRRRLLSRGVEYRRVDPTKPSIVFLAIYLENNRETLFLDISNDSRFLSMWSSDTGYTRYRVYGEGIDTNSLHESVLGLLPTDD